MRTFSVSFFFKFKTIDFDEVWEELEVLEKIVSYHKEPKIEGSHSGLLETRICLFGSLAVTFNICEECTYSEIPSDLH